MKLPLGILFGCTLTGCIIPLPHRRLHERGHEARVVDARTRSPIAGAELRSMPGGSLITTTDANGDFRIKPRWSWHAAYLVGPISYSMLPHFDLPPMWPPPFRVIANGYYSHASDPMRGYPKVILLKPEGPVAKKPD